MKNIPYVKHYDAAGNLINPLFKGVFRSPFPNRRERRAASGKTSTRPFSNKKGKQVIVTKIGPTRFVKYERKVTQSKGRTQVEFIEK